MTGKVWVDTNLWIYLYARNPPEKLESMKTLVDNEFKNILISTQILGELFNVMLKKNMCDPESASAIITQMIHTFPVVDINTVNVLKAIELNRIYKFSYWDCSVLASAIINDCRIFYSEDLQHNQLIQKTLRIINPFR